MSIASVLRRAGHPLEERFDRARFRVKRRLRLIQPVEIVPYVGFGNKHEVHVLGRVLEAKAIPPPEELDSAWKNLRMMIRRFNSEEIPDARVQSTFEGITVFDATDAEGYLDVTICAEKQLPRDGLWREVRLELLDEIVPGQGRVTATGRIQVPPETAAFGIISDIDDTVLRTGATNLLKMLRTTLLNNARTRTPFDGVAAFYSALQRGPSGEPENPIFYVSSSPWNLYDFLVAFFEEHDVPAGTLMLRDLGHDREKLLTSTHLAHKMLQIERVLSTYPDLPFILIGDSGQEDPEIFLNVVRAYPGRIPIVYIRDVREGHRTEEVRRIAETAGELGSEFVIIADSAAAARHAQMRGLITAGNADRAKANRAIPAATMEAVADRRPSSSRTKRDRYTS